VWVHARTAVASTLSRAFFSRHYGVVGTACCATLSPSAEAEEGYQCGYEEDTEGNTDADASFGAARQPT
jgi:hypothetical protein